MRMLLPRLDEGRGSEGRTATSRVSGAARRAALAYQRLLLDADDGEKVVVGS